MSCLGNDLNSVINRMDNNIRTVIKAVSPNTEINESGILNSILSQEQLGKIDKEIRDYLSNYLPGSLQNYNFFKRNPKTGELMYQFPTELKVAFEQKMQMDKQQEEVNKQAALLFKIFALWNKANDSISHATQPYFSTISL